MPRGRPKKRVKITQEDDCVDQQDIVQSSDSQEQLTKYQKNQDQKKYTKPFMARRSGPFTSHQSPSQNIPIRPTVPLGKKISIDEIKFQILTHTPDMKDQIDILDEETLREIYENELLPNLKPIQEDTKTQHQPYEQAKRSQRIPQIRQMIGEIIKNVPHMQEEVELLEDNDIRELYEEVCPASKILTPNAHKMNVTVSMNGINPKNMNEIRHFLYENLPDMLNEMKSLSDEDLMDVYKEYKDKEMPQSQSRQVKRSMSSYPSNQPKQPMKQYQPQREQQPYESYDPMKKFSVKEESKIDFLPSIYQNDRQHSPYGLFNNYKMPKNINFKPPQGPEINKLQSSNYPYEVHSFHNNRRVSTPPQDTVGCARTVIIVHTIQPGYVPPMSKPKCRCQCCAKRDYLMNDPNTLDEFIHNIIPKNSGRR